MEDHAVLSPSSGKQWLTCTPSVRAAANLQESSIYADEGSLAHKIGELLINRTLKRIRQSDFKARLVLLQANSLYFPAMLKHMEKYCSYVMQQYNRALAIDPTAQIFIEKKVSLREYVPESFGTADVMIFFRGHVWFIDLKYGAGVLVEAKDNTQLKLYALGALEFGSLFYTDFDEVQLTIYQPRMDNISTDIIPAKTVIEWGESYVRPRAALAWEGKGERAAGEHCRFCKLRGSCAVRAEYVQRVAQQAPAKAATLTVQEIARVLDGKEELKSWLNDVADYALQIARNGTEIPGYKIVTAKTNRFIKDPVQAADILVKAGFTRTEILNIALKGIGDLENLMGEEDMLYHLKDLIVKPKGGPTLAKTKDRRKAFNSPEEAFASVRK
jgi:hypothetical protein